MKQKFFAYALLPMLGLGLLGPGVASAMGFGWFGGFGNVDPDKTATRFQNMFQNQSQIHGDNVDELKEAWADGKTIKQLMDEKDITQEQVQARMKDAQLQQLKSQLQALVSKGVITQAQADKRLQAMQNQLQNSSGRKGKMGFMGFGFGRHFR